MTKPGFDEVERRDAADWQRGIEAMDGWKRETVKQINDPEKFVRQQAERVTNLKAELEREEAALLRLINIVANADKTLAEIAERRAYHEAGLKMRLGFDRALKARELYQQLKKLGMTPNISVGAMITEEDIVS